MLIIVFKLIEFKMYMKFYMQCFT